MPHCEQAVYIHSMYVFALCDSHSLQLRCTHRTYLVSAEPEFNLVFSHDSYTTRRREWSICVLAVVADATGQLSEMRIFVLFCPLSFPLSLTFCSLSVSLSLSCVVIDVDNPPAHRCASKSLFESSTHAYLTPNNGLLRHAHIHKSTNGLWLFFISNSLCLSLSFSSSIRHSQQRGSLSLW